MSTPLRINTLGTRWEVDLSETSEEVADELRRLWRDAGDWSPDTCEPAGFPRPLEVVSQPGAGRVLPSFDPDDPTQPLPSVIQVSDDPRTAPYIFSTAITARGIMAQSGRLTMLHAAALAHPDTGSAILLIAPSGTGKTTAARTLGRTLSYLSDETSALRPDHTIVAHPKPLSIVGEGGKSEASPAELGLLPPRADARLAATVLLERRAGQVAHLKPVPLIEALIEAIPQSSSLPAQERPLSGLAEVLRTGEGVATLVYSEIEDAAPVILDLLARSAPGRLVPADYDVIEADDRRRGTAWTQAPGRSAPSDAEPVVIERAAWIEALAWGSESLVLNGPQPVRLMGLGHTIWLAADKPIGLADIVEQVVAEHGPHPEAAELVRDAIAKLAEAGLVVFVAPRP